VTAIVYPAGLPPPSQWVATPRERRVRSALPGNTAVRGRSRDAITDITQAQWHYSPSEMTAWRSWYEDTLLNGMRWFAVTAPGPGGWVARVCRFRTPTVRREFLGRGIWRVSAQLEQRGRAVPPRAGMIVGFLTWARGVRDPEADPLTYVSEVGPDLISESDAAFDPSGGNVFGRFDTSPVDSYFWTVDTIAPGLVEDEEGNPRAWRLEVWYESTDYAYFNLTKSDLNQAVMLSVAPGGGAYAVMHRTASGFANSTLGSGKPVSGALVHACIEKLPGQQPRAWCSSPGTLSGDAFGWTTDWTDAYLAGARFKCGGSGVFHQARFAAWENPADPALFANGGYSPENPLRAV
jgi:hypothetical protein